MILKRFSKNLALSAQSNPWHKFCAVFLLSAFILGGCSNQKIESKFTVSEAQKKFEDKCLKDFNLHVRTRQVGQTFWVYLPIKEPIFDYEVQKGQQPVEQPKPRPQFVVNFADGKYNNQIFSFEYDIVEKKKSKEEDYGFNSSYTDTYVKIQNNLFTAIYEIFFNTKALNNEVPPQFFVVVITDIKKGIETRSTFYLKDFMRYMSGDIPNDEYMKRFLSDRKGSSAMIGDETGSHITYTNITLGEFLTKQILNRIHFKFQYSDFPPLATVTQEAFSKVVANTEGLFKNLIKNGYIDNKGRIQQKFRELNDYSPMSLDLPYISQKKEIYAIMDHSIKNHDDTVMAIIADTLRYYTFTDFTNVRLTNLRMGTKYLFDKAQLVNFGEEKPKENEGRLIHIRFKDGKPEFNDEEVSPAETLQANRQL